MTRNEAYREAERKIEEARQSGAEELDLKSEYGAAASKKLMELPESLSQLTQLRSLSLEHNTLTELPEWLGQLTRLRSLTVQFNRLSTLPQALGQLAQLQELYLNENQLVTLPESLGQLTELRSLILQDNQLIRIPESLGQLTKLRLLDLRSNQLTTLPDSLGQLIQLQFLGISNNRLTILPKSLDQLAQLESLDIPNNNLTTLPDSLGQLICLHSLNAGNNQLISLPESLGRLAQLKMLTLDNNLLADLPDSIGQLFQLEWLGLVNNQLTSLPESIGQLTQLEMLGISDNQLLTLPESIGHITQLSSLSLSDNQLTHLPASLANLTNLISLHLANNQLTTLAESLGQLPNLECLNIQNNPLPSEILRLYEEGRLISYLRELAHGRQKIGNTNQAYPIDEAKLLLVGPGEVGKTWLLQALQGEIPRSNSSTKGLEIARLPLDVSHPSQEGRTIHLNCWDFGGQENYQITHQIFFSPKAIYLLAWKPRPAMDGELIARLERIQLSAGQTAKVFIVSTHADDNIPAILGEEALKERFGDLIHGFYKVDSAKGPEGTGIAELKDEIARVAARLEGMDTPFPHEWHKAQNAVRAKKEPALSLREFSEICVAQGVKPESCESLAIIMDELGNAVFFGEAPQSEDMNVDADENLVILDPEWLAKAVAFVIEDESTRKVSGILSHERLHQIWKKDSKRDCPGYNKNLFGYLLWMMWKFDIAYKQTDKTSLVPELIHRNRPDDLLWIPTGSHPAGERQITLICRIPQDPPTGIIPALTAAVHPLRRARKSGRDWDDLDRNWREGFFLESEQRGTAFVELRDRDLYIVVRSAYPRALSSAIHKTLDGIKKDRWPQLNLDYHVPCIGHLAHGKPCTGTFRLEFLDKCRGQSVPCQTCYNDVEVGAMLEGFDAYQHEIRRNFEQLKVAQADLKSGQTELMVQMLRLYRDVLDPATHELLRAPNMLTIVPNEPGGWLSKATEHRVRVTCWCEHPDGPHIPQDDEGHATSEYVLKIPQDWLVRAAPYISWAAVLLKAFVPMVGTAIKAGVEEALPSDIKSQLDLMADASKALPTGKLELGHQDDIESADRQRPQIVALRHIHDALLAQVSEQKRWGELRPVRTKSGELLWLCAQHAELQQPSVQNI